MNIDGHQEHISKPFIRPKRYSPIFVYAAKIEEEGKNNGKATISNLEVVPNAKGFIDGGTSDIDGGGSSSNNDGENSVNEITVYDPKGSSSKFNLLFYFLILTILAIYIKHKLLLKTVMHWGPSFEIRFRLKVKSFDGQVLHLCTGKETADGVPTVEAINQRIEVTTIVGSKKERFVTRTLETRVWYYIVISQKQSKTNSDRV